MSETVKLIVTLSKGQYENLKDIQFGGIGSKMIFNAVRNGIPLEEVRTEINNLPRRLFEGYFFFKDDDVLKTIDKIGKGGKE